MGKNHKRKFRSRWAHFGYQDGKLSARAHAPRDASGLTAPCGKTAEKTDVTFDKNNVTCPRCVGWLKENHWHCKEHGFLDPGDVSFDERCEYCGKPVAS